MMTRVIGLISGIYKNVKLRRKLNELDERITVVENSFKRDVYAKEFEVKRLVLSKIGARYSLRAVFNVNCRRKDECINIIASSLTLNNILSVAKSLGVSYSPIMNQYKKWYGQRLRNYQETLVRLLIERATTEAVINGVNPNYARNYYTQYYSGMLNGNEVENTMITGLIRLIKNFKPEVVRDEEDFEKQLYQYLRASLGSGVNIERQVSLSEGLRVDMVVDDTIAIEIKIAENKAQLQRLIGQVIDYKKYFDKVMTVILDAGRLRDLDSYIEKLEELGAVPIVVKGKVRRLNGRK